MNAKAHATNIIVLELLHDFPTTAIDDEKNNNFSTKKNMHCIALLTENQLKTLCVD